MVTRIDGLQSLSGRVKCANPIVKPPLNIGALAADTFGFALRLTLPIVIRTNTIRSTRVVNSLRVFS